MRGAISLNFEPPKRGFLDESMRYIRFLKPPKLSRNEKQKTSHVTALITITSDLGESFYTTDVVVAAILRLENGAILLSQTYQWRGGMRTLAVELNLKHVANVRLRLQVAPKEYLDGGELLDMFKDPPNDILPAWSTMLEPFGHTEASKHVDRKFKLSCGYPLLIREETGESIARHIWDAGLVLTAYLNHAFFGAPKTSSVLPVLHELLTGANQARLKAIELGAGCGIVGIGLAQLLRNCDVVLTDLAEAEEIVQWNINTARPAANAQISFAVLDWDEALPPHISDQIFSLILVADCTYNSDSVPSLVKMLSILTDNSPDAMVLLAQKVRHDSEAVFFDLMEEAGLLQVGHDEVSLPINEDKGLMDSAENVDIYAFQARSTSIGIK